MKINIFTELELTNIKSTGIVTSYKGLKEGLESENIKVTINEKDGYDILHIHSFGPLSLIKAIREKKPVVITTHTVPDEIPLLYRGGKYFEGLFEKYLTFMYNQADLLISPSEFTKSRVKNIGVKSKIVAESNGINVNKFHKSEEKREQFRKKYGIKKNETLIGCVGLPSKRKGLDIVEKVAKKLPDVKFIWIGENVYGRLLKDYKYLEKLKMKHPENLIIAGYVDDIQAAYSGMDIFIFPTMIETEGLVILEAVCSDLPLITSKIDGLYWVKDKDQCLKADSIEEYVNAINMLINNPKKVKDLVTSSKKLIDEKNMSVVIKRIIKLYETLL